MKYEHYAVIKQPDKGDREIILQGSFEECKKKYWEIHQANKDNLLNYWELHGGADNSRNVVRIALSGYDIENEDFFDIYYFCYYKD